MIFDVTAKTQKLLIDSVLSASFQMEHKRTWYIPRPSLSSTSSSNTTKSHDSIRCYHRNSEVIDIERSKEKKSSNSKNAASSSSSSSVSSQRSKDKINMETCIDGECETPKRGSRSSQGSSDSEQSIHVSIQ